MGDRQGPSRLDNLPVEIIFNILEQICPYELRYSMRRVSKYFHRMLSSSSVLDGSPILKSMLRLDQPVPGREIIPRDIQLHPILDNIFGNVNEPAENVFVYGSDNDEKYKICEISAKDENLIAPAVSSVWVKFNLTYISFQITNPENEPISLWQFLTAVCEYIAKGIEELRRDPLKEEMMEKGYSDDKCKEERAKFRAKFTRLSEIDRLVKRGKFAWTGARIGRVIDDNILQIRILKFGKLEKEE